MLTNTLKISDTTKTEFIDLTSFRSDQNYETGSATQI